MVLVMFSVSQPVFFVAVFTIKHAGPCGIILSIMKSEVGKHLKMSDHLKFEILLHRIEKRKIYLEGKSSSPANFPFSDVLVENTIFTMRTLI